MLERLRVTPVSRVALLLGRVLRDTLVVSVQAALLLGVGVVFWLRAPAAGIVLAMVFVVLLTVSVASLSYTVALWARSEDAFAPLLTALLVPLMLLSGILLPMTMAPGWLQALSWADPFRYFVDATRAVFHGDDTSAALARGAVVAVVLTVAAVAYGARRFRSEHA